MGKHSFRPSFLSLPPLHSHPSLSFCQYSDGLTKIGSILLKKFGYYNRLRFEKFSFFLKKFE